ncbi:hypothetical protein WR25_13521 [Diploscapter pachys]|uniref:Uncharacterized protein n=1 Tax=Diploscapter pachys TaxID=2018661 RepID=A0A2A2JVX4_9BILA|nr:hypothetical protein WR25_13521 [Diploscapter pachys]
MKYPFGPKISQIEGGHQKAISKIILSKSDFKEKKRAFIKFTDKYSHENRRESFDKVTDEEGLFWALEVKTHIDKFVLKLLREMFYNPIAEKEKLTDDEWEAKSAPERYFRMALEYIFPGETIKVEIDADQTVKREL